MMLVGTIDQLFPAPQIAILNYSPNENLHCSKCTWWWRRTVLAPLSPTLLRCKAITFTHACSPTISRCKAITSLHIIVYGTLCMNTFRVATTRSVCMSPWRPECHCNRSVLWVYCCLAAAIHKRKS